MKSLKSSAKKPVVITGIMTEFGEFKDDPRALFDEVGASGDPTYVPGFSDMRRQADLDRAEGRVPQALPVNLRWVRRTRVSGMPVNDRLIHTQHLGYEAVRFDQIGTEKWITGCPPTAQELPDGTIGNADSVLMVQSAEKAQRREVVKRLRWLEQATGSQDAALQKAAAQVLPGANPTVTKELGPAVSK